MEDRKKPTKAQIDFLRWLIQETKTDPKCFAVLKEKTVQRIPALYVVCGICAASGPKTRTKADAIEAWNRRAERFGGL